MPQFDVIVLGLGAMGSSAAYHLAGRGAKVLGLEQFAARHNRGSSHGALRLIRKAYFEHEAYVPLVKRSYELWRDLAQAAEREILVQNGLVISARPDNKQTLPGLRRASEQHAISIEELSAPELKRRFPLLAFPEDHVGIYEPSAGYLKVDAALNAHLEGARRLGATLQFEEKLLEWSQHGKEIVVETTRGRYQAAALVIAAGAWLNKVVGKNQLPSRWPMRIERVPQRWYPAPDIYSAAYGMPCFAADLENEFIYGFPKVSEDGIKIASHKSRGQVLDPDDVDRKIHSEDLRALDSFRKSFLPKLTWAEGSANICMYTMTPDEHFLIDRHPDYENIFVASPCSGHGFKFSPVIGEVLADLVFDGQTRHPIDFLKYRWR